jgi:hypothetical protein
MRSVVLKYSSGQRECLWESESYPFRIITKGRRFGLTYAAAMYLIEKMMMAPCKILWGDVSYGNIRRYVDRIFIPLLKRSFKLREDEYSYSQTQFILKVGESVLDFRSAERPETWEGFGYNIIFLNEAGIILRDADYLYENAILPMLMDYEGAMLIAGGVPKGKSGVFYKLWQKAVDENEHSYKAFNFTSYDNPFINTKVIKELEGQMDYTTAQQEIYGHFVDNVNNPFLYAFDYEKHVRDVEIGSNSFVNLSFDFNVDPITCIVVQDSGNIINIVDEFRLKGSDIFKLCEQIKIKYPRISRVTGDASGRSRSALTRDNYNFYTVIERELRVPPSANITPLSNPRHHDSRVLCNSILATHKNLVINPRCKYLIRDLKQVEADSKGNVEKSKDSSLTHLLDCFRYYINSFHGNYLDFIRVDKL